MAAPFDVLRECKRMATPPHYVQTGCLRSLRINFRGLPIWKIPTPRQRGNGRSSTPPSRSVTSRSEGALRADGRAGGRALPAGEQILLRGEGVREVLLPLHQPRLGALRLLHRPRLRLPRRAREARPPPPRVSPLPHPRHRALHEGRAQQDDHGRGRRPLRTHGLLLRIRVRKEGKGTVQDALLNRPSYAQVALRESDGSERKEHRA